MSQAGNIWDGGGGSENWSDTINWDPDGAPVYGTLTFAGSVQTTNTVDASVSQNVLRWTDTSSWTLNSSGGSVISLFDDSGAQAKIENLSTGLVTINAPIDFAATAGTNRAEINAVNGDLTFGSGGTITVSGSAVNELHFYGSGRTVTINSVITAGARKLVIGPSVTDNNTVLLNAANSYSGNTEVNVGTVQVGNNIGLGTSAVFLGNGGATFANLNASLLLNANGLTVTNAITTNKADTGGGFGSGTRTIGGAFTSGNSTFSGTLTLNGGAVLTAGNGGSVTYSGNIVNGTDTGSVSRDLSVTGTGATVVLSGTGNTYTGKTSVNGGATLSINADARLGNAPVAVVADQLTLNNGTLRITAGGQTLNANRGITLGVSGGIIDSSTIAGTAITTTIGGVIAGNGPLTLRSTGNLSPNGGADGGLGIRLNQATNTFTGDVIITAGLVSYANNLSFGNAANKIVLNGGGLLDNNVNIALARNIEVQAGGGTFRGYGSTNANWSGSLTGTGSINRTDGGIFNHSGDLSGFGGTYNVQGGTSQLTGTAATIGGNWTIASGTNLTVNSTSAQTLAGSVTGTGTFLVTSTGGLTLTGSTDLGTGIVRINGAGVATLNAGGSINADQIALTGTTSNQLNIGGGTVTTRYLNIGDGGNNSGRVVQTGGTVTINAGGTGMRIGHWTNGSNAGSVYNLSGGTLNASAIGVTIGHDGQGDMIVGGGAGAALFRASSIQLDANGNGGGNGPGDMTLTVSTNGTVEVGTGGIGAAAAGDRVILNGGVMKAVGNTTWGSVFNANSATTSDFNANNFAVTLTNNITGTGAINLSSATGSVTFNTGGNQTVAAGINGSTAIFKSGAGTTTLSGTGTHSGTITVNDGRLNLAGSTFSAISLAAGRTLGGEGTTTGPVTLNGGFLNIDPTTSGKLTVGDLNLTGTNNVRFDIAPAAAGGAFDVLTYTGSLTGTLGTNLVVENAARYRNSTFVDTGGVVTLDIQSKNLTWNGTSGGQWDVLTSSRWNTAEADQFAWGDAVTFDDSGVATSIALTGELRPSSITVAGTKNYTLTGGTGNFISGMTGIAKSGSSTLLLNAPNTFSGANTITGGTLQVGDGTNNTAALGTGSVSVGAGSSLAFFRSGGSSVNNAISGAGTLAFQGTGVINQSDYSIGGNNSAFTGTLDVRSGARVILDSANDAGTSAIVVNSGGQIYLNGGVTYANAVSINGIGWTETAGNLGAVRFETGTTLSGPVTLAGNSRLTTWSGATGTISGVINDGASSFGLTKTGTGTLTLTQANTYDGGTTLSFGRVNIHNASSLGTGAVTLGDASSSTNAISLYLDTNRVNFSRAVTVSSNGTGTVTLGSMSGITGSGDNNQFTSIALQRNVTFDSNAADRTDYENISGTGNITVAGAGRSIFMTNNTYVGNLTINTSADANGLQLGTISTAFNALSDTGSVQIDSGGKLSLSYTTGGSETIGALTGAGTVRINSNAGNINTVILGNGNGSGTFSGIIGGGTGTLAITKVGTGTQTFSGANTYTGATAINGGTLALDFATQNNTKLSDTAALSFGAGSGTISLAGGSHTEVVASTTLAAGAVANITRPSGTSVLQLGTITVGTNASLNLSAGSIATTNNLNNAGGILGTWATVGTDWAQSAASGTNIPITAYTGYVNYTRLSSGTKAIANNATDNARIQEGTGTAANLTLAAATTNINTLNLTATGGATTLDMGTNTLRLGTAGGILAGPGVSALTIGSAVNQGFLSAGGSTTGTAGTLQITNNSSNTITINSALINNGSGAVTLVKSGSGLVTLAGNTGGTYSGGTFVNQGELRVVAPTTAATYSTLGTGAVTVGTGATLRFFTGSTTAAIAYGNAINLTNATLAHQDGNHTLSGLVSLTGANTITGVWAGKNLTMTGVISGSGSLIKTNTGGESTTLTLSNINTYTGGTTVDAGTLTLANGGGNGAIRGTVTVNSGTTLNYSVNNAFGFNGGASVNVLNINGGTVGNAGFGNHFWNSFQLNMTAGTLNLGTNVGQVTNDWQSPTITTNASANTATIAAIDAGAVMRLRDNTHATFNVADGAAAIDLSVTAAITQSGGVSNITKTGAGLMQISGVNAYTGTTTISGGTLRISGAGSLNSGNYGATITNNGTLEFTSTASQILGGNIGGSGSITKSTGTGTLTLGGSNTYTGATTINSGRLTLTGTNASSLTINTGATLTSSGSTTGGLIANTGSTIALNGTVPATGLSAGVVNFAGTTALVFDAMPALGSTTHTVVGYSSVAGVGNLSMPTGYRGSISNNTGASRVELNITTGTRTWNLASPGTWNVLTNTSWAEGDNTFASGDAVVFDDTAANGAVLLAGTLVPSSVTFNNSTTSYALTGSGVIAGTTGLTKNGSGTASIATNNTYTGATAINAGALNIQHANALGATTAGTTVASGAALEIQGGITTAAEALTLNGTGITSTSGALRNVSGNNTYAGTINFASASTIYAESGTTLTTTGLLTLANTLTKTGDGTLRLTSYNGSTAAAASDIVINAGAVEFASGYFNTSPFGYRALNITVNSGGILRTTTAHALGGDNIDGGTSWGQVRLIGGEWNHTSGGQYVSGGTVSGGEGRVVMQSGTITGAGDIRMLASTISTLASTTSSTISNSGGINLGFGGVTFNVAEGAAATDLRVSAVISGTNGVIKSGAGLAEFSGSNTYTGATTVSQGTLLINGATATGSTVGVAAGATLGGTGTIGGAVNVTGVLSPGASIETLGTGTLSLANASALVHELDSSVATSVGSDLVKVTGNLNLAGTVGISLSDIAVTDVAFNMDDVFSLINYTGTWNGGLFTFNGNELADEEVFIFGLNNWKISYDDLVGGLNYSGEQVSGSFVNLTVVPEPRAALLGGLGLLLLLRRRR